MSFFLMSRFSRWRARARAHKVASTVIAGHAWKMGVQKQIGGTLNRPWGGASYGYNTHRVAKKDRRKHPQGTRNET